MEKSCNIKRRLSPIEINADWNKEFWQGVDAINVDVVNWPVQSVHFPKSQVKLQYDAENLYVIFRVEDKYVRAAVTETNGPVYRDSCVEFFFAPSLKCPNSYFNFEINCSGVLFGDSSFFPF